MDLCATSDRYRNADPVHNTNTAAAVAAAAASVYPQNYISNHDNQNSGGLLFWPWAAAAAANGYYGSAAAAIDFEQHLYKFGYNPSALISAGSQFNSGNGNYPQNLFQSDMCMQNTENYMSNSSSNLGESNNNKVRLEVNESIPRNEHGNHSNDDNNGFLSNTQNSDFLLSPPIHQGGHKSLSRPPSLTIHPESNNNTQNHGSDSILPNNIIGGSSSVPPLPIPTPVCSPSGASQSNIRSMTIKPNSHHLISQEPTSPSSYNKHEQQLFTKNKFLSPLSSTGLPTYTHKYSGYSRPYFNYHSSQSHSNCIENGPPPTKGYKCKMCQQLCFSKHDLARHNASAHKQDPRPYRCEHCGRQFSTGAYLGQHRRIHLGIKPYICRFCERRFTQLSHVQQHERIHTGEKPYRCLACLKSFTQMSNLQSHQRQHMKGKPYRCEHCFMCFDLQEELDTHVQAKHAGHKYSKILVCPICGKNYNSETYLNKHILKHKESAAAANMSVMAAAVNAVAAAAAHLPRPPVTSTPPAPPSGLGPSSPSHNSSDIPLLDTSNIPGGHNTPFYYPQPHNSTYPHTQHPNHHQHQHHPHYHYQHHLYPSQHHYHQSHIPHPYNSSSSLYNSTPHHYFNNPAAFMNPDHLMSTMNSHLFNDPFDQSNFGDHCGNGEEDEDNIEAALCMKKSENSEKDLNSKQANEINSDSNEEKDDEHQSKEENNSGAGDTRDSNKPSNNLESVLFGNTNLNLPIINFDTSVIDEQLNNNASTEGHTTTTAATTTATTTTNERPSSCNSNPTTTIQTIRPQPILATECFPPNNTDNINNSASSTLAPTHNFMFPSFRL